MKAATQSSYGLDSIELTDRPIPTPGPGQVRVRVETASINPADWHLSTGRPWFVRLTDGLRRPNREILGTDVAGVIDEVGPGVAPERIGDRVFGKAHGAFAEVAVADLDRLALIPERVGFDEAAGLPIAGVTALQAIEKGDVQGKSVVVNGASGGVGHFAVQIARALGAAHVTGVCSSRNVEFVRSLGVDQVVDYTAEDFTTSPHDVIVECAGSRTAADLHRGLNPGGRVIMVGPKKGGRMLGPIPSMVAMMARFAVSDRSLVAFVADETAERLTTLADLYSDGALHTSVSREFALPDVVSAFDHLATSRAVGKVLVRP
jgi:NADPH:quinone reductase-like Zn-dependent oxidoreductase